MRTTIAILNKQEEKALKIDEYMTIWNDGQGVLYNVASPSGVSKEKTADKIRKQEFDSNIIAISAFSIKQASKFSYLTLDNKTILLEGSIYSPAKQSALADQLTKNHSHCEAVLQALIREADGDYLFLMLDKDWLAVGRDPVGVQPLYYGENKDVAAVASNRKALWTLGIEETRSFPPGNLAFVNKHGFLFKPIKNLFYKEPQPTPIGEASAVLISLLKQSVQRRLHGVKKVAVAFSGGLDSSIIAFLAQQCDVKVILFHVSLENQPETDEAIKAAEVLGLPLQLHLFKQSDVEAVLPKILELIEEPDPIKISIGVPFYFVAESAAASGFNVLLAGQGADELFGGYQRYVQECCKDGNEKVLKTMFNDVLKIHESNIERDEKICLYHDIDLRLPFASFDIVEFAVNLPVNLKFEKEPNSLRKLVLRKAASDLDLPALIVNKPKKAVQYSTGINDAVKRIAKKRSKTVREYIDGLWNKQTKMIQ